MPEPIEIDVQVVDDPGCDPRTVYDLLRSYTPGRASFLFETLDPEHPDARYSVVGYRVRQGGLMPPGVDAFDVLDKDVVGDRPETFAEAMARGTVGYLSASSALIKRGVRLFEDEGPSGHLVSTAAVLVYDHREGTHVVAAPKRGDQAERLVFELETALKKGTHREPPEVAPDATPEALTRWFDAAKLEKRHARAKPFFGDEVDALVLYQMYVARQNETDPFAAYQALVQTRPGPFGYFIDFGQSPMAPEVQLFGVGREVIHQHRRQDATPIPGALAEALHDALPHPSTVGRPVDKAAKLLRKVEQNARLIWGGAVGYACPGGEASFVLADDVVFAQDGNFWVGRGVEIDADTDPTAIAERLDADAQPTLAALAAASKP